MPVRRSSIPLKPAPSGYGCWLQASPSSGSAASGRDRGMPCSGTRGRSRRLLRA